MSIRPRPAAPTLSYQALDASLADASISGIPGIILSVDAIGVRLNQATDTAPAAPAALNWTTAVDVDRDGTFGDAVVITDASGGERGVEFTGDFLRITASNASLTIDELIEVSGDLAFDRQTVDVSTTAAAGAELVGATLTRIAVTNVDVSLTLGPITVSATGGNLYLAQVTPAGAAPTLSYQALDASLADASITGIPGITLSVDAIGVRLNQASDTPTAPAALNWTNSVDVDRNGSFGDAVVITDATGEERAVEFTGDFLRITASNASLVIADLIEVSGDLAFERQTVD